MTYLSRTSFVVARNYVIINTKYLHCESYMNNEQSCAHKGLSHFEDSIRYMGGID